MEVSVLDIGSSSWWEGGADDLSLRTALDSDWTRTGCPDGPALAVSALAVTGLGVG